MSMRILIYTGKGGVGKTSMACAAACRLSAQGKRVMIMSTDQAHSLGDAFRVPLSNEPTEVSENLRAVEIDTGQESRRAWGSLHDYLLTLMKKRGTVGIEADEVLVFPTFEELFAMLRILDAYEAGDCDVLIVDCAPTGETLSMLRFPERLGIIVRRFLPLIRAMTMSAGFVISLRTGVPKPQDVVFRDFDVLTQRLMKLQSILSDADTTSIRIVTTPERIVMEEARRNYTWMHLYGFNVDAVIINRIYPESAMEGYFHGWSRMQEESLQIAAESFPDRKLFKMELQDHEIGGPQMLLEMADLVYGGCDISQVFTKEKTFWTEKRDGMDVFCVALPFAHEEEVEAGMLGGDLIVSFRNERRRFKLPDNLRGREISTSTWKDGVLTAVLSSGDKQ